jgi:hypothetical protein
MPATRGRRVCVKNSIRNTVTLSGPVTKEEVLPSSRRDDALRMNLYRAIYEKQRVEDTTLASMVSSDEERDNVQFRA